MKKMLSWLGILAVGISSVSAVVSCGALPERYQKIYTITDAGKVADRSFNQSGYNGGNLFVQEGLWFKDLESAYAQPGVMTDAPYMYDQAFKQGADTLILPGFKHGPHLDIISDGATKSNGSAVYIDGSGEGKESIVGLLYRADMSGFWAGIASIIYVSGQGIDPVLATFGGMNNGTAVDDFMAGFLASVYTYNWAMGFKSGAGEGYELPEGIQNVEARAAIEGIAKTMGVTDLRPADIWSAQKNGYDDPESLHSNWFTDTFNPGGGSTVSRLMLNGGANVIMGVAGPQTADIISAIRESGKQAYIVGVDTDQATQYTQDADLFITSAEKDIVHSTALSIAHSPQYYDEMMKQESTLGDVAFADLIQNTLGGGLAVTYKDGEKFVEVDPTIFEDNSATKKDTEKIGFADWTQKDFWMGGSISTSETNKVKIETFEAIKEAFGLAMEASLMYFENIKGNESKPAITLSQKMILEYATINYQGLGKTTSKEKEESMEVIN